MEIADKITIHKLKESKRSGSKIAMLTAYDYPTAKILDDAGIEIVLVGDSVGNVVLGYENTLPVTMDEMIHHAKAVGRAVKRSMLVADMPFMSYQLTDDEAFRNASRFVKEAGVQAVKLEGDIYIERIKLMVKAGIPVMGHIGFTPQLVNQLGGYKVQGKSIDDQKMLLESAKKLENAGVFSIVLEMVPEQLAKKITESIDVPTIGIGAGRFCDGQVLVFHDLVGFYDKKSPKFAKSYLNLNKEVRNAVSNYIKDVRSGSFPAKEHSF